MVPKQHERFMPKVTPYCAGALLAASVLASCTGEIFSGSPAGPDDPKLGLDDAVGDDGAGPGASPPGSLPGPGEPTTPETVAALCEDRAVATQPLRRLSSGQYGNTMRDLFGSELSQRVLADSLFPRTVIERGFANDAEANVVNTAESNAIEDNAERIAALVLQDPDAFLTLMPCGGVSASDASSVDGCIDEFIAQFGRRAYRRPLTAGETTILRDLYDLVRQDGTATEAFSAVVQLMVQSPALLYRAERGQDEVVPGMLRLDSYEMASRLSYFLLDSMPDETLFQEAEAGRLTTPDEVAAQARRLMDSPVFESVLDTFHRDWLQLYHLEDGKNAAQFPGFTADVQASLMQEVGRFVSYIVNEGDGSVQSLLSENRVPLDATLAAYYGVSAGADGEPVELAGRAGLLTLASTMAAQARTDRTDPIHRGLFVQSEVLCNDLPSLPADVDTQTTLMGTSDLPTARQRLAPLLEDPSCSFCHQQFNPTGLGLENFDAVGLWRDVENDTDIDPSGQVTVDGEVVPFDTPLQLTDAIAGSIQARDCYARQWFRSSVGRHEAPQDLCSIASVTLAATESNGDIRAMLEAIVRTDAFMYRAVEEVGP